MAKIYDKVINYENPQIETNLVLCTQSLENEEFTIDIDKYMISLSKKEKEYIIKEWDLMEKCNEEWKKTGNKNQEEYIAFLDKAHNPK